MELTTRERTELWERERLSRFAFKSADSAGREISENKCDIRTEFQRDRDRITHSKAFRRLMHKTQVFISPEGDHYRTRLSHTLEVAQIARTISRALGLNEDLTEAIAIGHDLGHTPFGHTGEDALDRLMPGGFLHNEQSGRVVCFLEKSGRGLNLTREVIDGIINHRTSGTPATLEAKVVQISDKIGYINHDIDDAVRAGILDPAALPRESVAVLGDSSRARIDCLIKSVIETSGGINDILLDQTTKSALYGLRSFMFETVYQGQLQRVERHKIRDMIGAVYEYYLKNLLALPDDYIRMLDEGETAERVVCDYIACMTDRYLLKQYFSIFVPNAWNI